MAVVQDLSSKNHVEKLFRMGGLQFRNSTKLLDVPL